MQFLFVHQNFPGQYMHLVRNLVAGGRHEVTFLTNPNANRIAGVRKIAYEPLRPSTPGVHYDAREFESAMIRAQSVAATAAKLAAIGYRPDIMLGHNGWGETLSLKDVWPDVPLVPYFEFFYHDRGLDVDFDPEFPLPEAQRATVRAKNAVNLLGLQVADAGQTPTRFQQGTYPAWARDRIAVVPEGVDLHACRPRPDAVFTLPGERRRWRRDARGGGRLLLTYVARNLEPYRGFHVFMRALPRILAERQDVDVVLVGGDGVSYGAAPEAGTWKERFLAELGDQLPPGRVFFPGKIAYDQYLLLLQTSAVHVYLTYPFVASWSLREALACGCAIVASDTEPVREFVADGETGRLVPGWSADPVAEVVLDLLEDAPARRRLGAQARAYAEAHLSLENHQRAFDELVTSATRHGTRAART